MKSPLSRRRLLLSGAAGAAAFGVGWRPALAALGAPGHAVEGFGAPVRDRERLLDLPPGFSYRVISRAGDAMDDGLAVPGLPDGMHAFAGPGGTTVLLRNHELNVGDRDHAFAWLGHIPKAARARMYDPAVGTGGVTAVWLEPGGGRVRRQFLSLAGTLRNCAGGPTPWGSWVSCEESVVSAGQYGSARSHGFAFEVRSAAEGLEPARPLVAMGRFHREAVAVDPGSGVVYQTEDRADGLFYRFVPRTPGVLGDGGRLEALAVTGFEGADTGNREPPGVPARQHLPVHWVPLDEPQAPADDLRLRGRAAGASVFVRGEGMAVEPGDGGVRIWFKCTAGGPRGLGQIWCYRPSPADGTAAQGRRPGTLELFLEPADASLMNNGDNLALAPNGDLLVCEDNGRTGQRILGVTPAGGVYTLARSAQGDSEFAGACFSPDGRVLYANLQLPGLTFAIRGPWSRRLERPRA